MNTEANQRLQRIICNIRPQTAFNERYGPPKTLAGRMAHLHTPAASIAIVDNYQIAAVGAYGTCKAGTERKVSPETRFLAGSISKSVFAVVVMYLVQDGVIDLDITRHCERI